MLQPFERAHSDRSAATVRTVSEPSRPPTRSIARRRHLAALGFAVATGAGILVIYLLHPAINGFRLPIGPDGPVYTWLARLGGEAGIGDAPGGGPGVPALTLVLGSVLRTEPVETVMLLGPVLAAATGLAGGALLESTLGHDRLRTATGVILTGAFAAYLAGGWLANLALVAVFLVAVAALSSVATSLRAVWSGAALLAAGGLAHRVFVIIGAVVLVAAAGWRLVVSLRGPRSERDSSSALRLATAALAGPAAGLAVAAWAGAGQRIPGDTSQDGFFRRAGLRALLLDRYRERFLGDAARTGVPIASAVGLTLAWAQRDPGRDEGGRFLREVLASWAVLTAGGIFLLAATGWGPPYRVLQFAFFLPVAAAAGLAILARRSRAVALTAGLLGVAFVVASMVGWFRQAPAFSPDELTAASRAGVVASSLPAGTPIVILVDTAEPAAAYHVTRASNVIRAAVPADRIADVRLAVGRPLDLLAGRPTLTGDREHDRISEVYLEESRPLLDRAALLVIRRFNSLGFEEAMDVGVPVADGVVILSRGQAEGGETFVRLLEQNGPADTTETPGLDPPALFLLSPLALAALLLLGWGWAGWILPVIGPPGIALAAPAVGVAVAIVATVVTDGVGVLPGSGAGVAFVGSIGVLGYVLAARDSR